MEPRSDGVGTVEFRSVAIKVTKIPKDQKPRTGREGSRIRTVVTGPTIQGKREVWHLDLGGKENTIVTSATSASAMDTAVVIYRDALERLAKR
jgi:hypothetical protein